MLKTHDQHKLLLETFGLGLGLDVPPAYDSLGFSDVVIRNELTTLQHSNDLLRKQSADLKSRNEELEAYAHTVAHALKNPLAAIIVTSGAISDIHDLTPMEIREYLQQITSTAFEMNSIIDDLMLLSEVGNVDRPVEPVDMSTVVANVQRQLGRMIKQYKGRIVSPDTWPVAIGYAPWIEEVWENYITNALKYGGRSPCIELGASIQTNGMIRFWTRDRGPGIPKKTQLQLFTPFTRLSLVHRPGHGLGLSIVRRIIEKLGGQVGVESEAGKGSLFYFSLPASPAITESVPKSAYEKNIRFQAG
jgi:two-component system, sensor histidine kinase and response regulator